MRKKGTTHLEEISERRVLPLLLVYLPLRYRVVGSVVPVGVSPLEQSVEDEIRDGGDDGMLISLTFAEPREEVPMDDQDFDVVPKDLVDELLESFGTDDGRFGFSKRGDEELEAGGKKHVRAEIRTTRENARGLTLSIDSRSETYSISPLMTSKMTLQVGRGRRSDVVQVRTEDEARTHCCLCCVGFGIFSISSFATKLSHPIPS